MSLSKKINDEMMIIALKIVRRSQDSEDKKVAMLANAYFDLSKLLKLALELETNEKKA